MMLENYCRINITTENGPKLYLCLLQDELKLQAIVSKVDNFREKWMGKDNKNRQQPFRVKCTLSGADVEQQSDKRTPISVRGGGAGGAAAPPVGEKIVLFGQN